MKRIKKTDEDCANPFQSLVGELRDELQKTHITDHDRLVISAYTGYLMCNFSKLHEFIEKTLGRPVFVHELANPSVTKEIQKKLKTEWLAICGPYAKEEA